MLVALALYISLPPKLELGPAWVAPILVAALLLPLFLASDRLPETLRRVGSVTLISVLNFFNMASVLLLINDLVNSKAKHHGLDAIQLLQYGGAIWITNIIVFALWYWEIDDGGVAPRNRVSNAAGFLQPDFLFPQMTMHRHDPNCSELTWKPMFLDYLYLSFTNALAFSPTDTMPLTRISKMLMLVESLISFTTVALILARSVNILS